MFCRSTGLHANAIRPLSECSSWAGETLVLYIPDLQHDFDSEVLAEHSCHFLIFLRLQTHQVKVSLSNFPQVDTTFVSQH